MLKTRIHDCLADWAFDALGWAVILGSIYMIWTLEAHKITEVL